MGGLLLLFPSLFKFPKNVYQAASCSGSMMFHSHVQRQEPSFCSSHLELTPAAFKSQLIQWMGLREIYRKQWSFPCFPIKYREVLHIFPSTKPGIDIWDRYRNSTSKRRRFLTSLAPQSSRALWSVDCSGAWHLALDFSRWNSTANVGKKLRLSNLEPSSSQKKWTQLVFLFRFNLRFQTYHNMILIDPLFPRMDFALDFPYMMNNQKCLCHKVPSTQSTWCGRS
jgi:hypothetical protein